MSKINNTVESDEIKKRFGRRNNIPENRYSILKPDVYLAAQEKERAIIRFLNWKRYADLKKLKLLEIGCGNGVNLLKFIELGFDPKNLVGNELIKERALSAKSNLPTDLTIINSDAMELSFEIGAFDIICQFTVFTSILSENFKKKLSENIWTFLKDGGGILWYDFIYNNPFNKDVKGISIKEIKNLFPDGKIKYWRVTLLPQLARAVTKIHPDLYSLFNLFPFLRTHVLCWVEK